MHTKAKPETQAKKKKAPNEKSGWQELPLISRVYCKLLVASCSSVLYLGSHYGVQYGVHVQLSYSSVSAGRGIIMLVASYQSGRLWLNGVE